MEYLSVSEEAEKWGVTPRQVQSLCGRGRIAGAKRISRAWMIPAEAQKPLDGRRRKPASAEQPLSAYSFPNPPDPQLLADMIEFFPYPIHVYAADGTLIMTNRAFLRLFNIGGPERVVGKFNVLTDPLMDIQGVKQDVLRSFRGETVHREDVRVPLPVVMQEFGHRELSFSSLFQHITSFPVYGKDTFCVVAVFVTSRIYTDKQEIVAAKEHIDTHWLDEFDLDRLAACVNLSRYHFARLFKKHIGMTPYKYYQDIKLARLKEALCDRSLSVAQAFVSCGVAYSGNYARIFREKIGMTPSQYRKSMQD